MSTSSGPAPEHQKEGKVMKNLLKVVILVIGFILVLDGVVLVARGVLMTVHSYLNLLDPTVDRPLLHALEAVDLFFMALVFFIMAIGLVQLFVGDLPLVRSSSLAWLKIHDFTALKVLLWDTFLVTMLVLFVTKLVQTKQLEWSVLIMPAAILMLTVSSFLLKRKH